MEIDDPNLFTEWPFKGYKLKMLIFYFQSNTAVVITSGNQLDNSGIKSFNKYQQKFGYKA